MLSLLLLLSDQGQVTLGEDVEASINPRGGALRCEPSVGVSGNAVLVAWNDSYGGKHGSQTGVCAGWSHSNDGGKSFNFGGYLTEREGVTAGADTRIARAGDGRLYLSVLSWFEKEHELRLYRFQDGRMTDLGQVATNGGTGYLDKPDFAIDGGRFALAYTRDGVIEYARSDDGKAWSRTSVSSTEKLSRSGSGVAVRGERVVVGWFEGGGIELDRLMVVNSHDGGKTFSPPSSVFVRESSISTPAGFRMAPGPASVSFNDVRLKFDDKGTAWLATLDVHEKKPRVVVYSSNDMLAWVRTDAVGTVDGAFFPDLAIVGGSPAVLSYGSDGTMTNCYLLHRGRQTCLSTVGSDWTKTAPDADAAPIQRNFGDYISLASEGDKFVAAWTDGRSGLPRIRVRVGKFERE